MATEKESMYQSLKDKNVSFQEYLKFRQGTFEDFIRIFVNGQRRQTAGLGLCGQAAFWGSTHPGMPEPSNIIEISKNIRKESIEKSQINPNYITENNKKISTNAFVNGTNGGYPYSEEHTIYMMAFTNNLPLCIFSQGNSIQNYPESMYIFFPKKIINKDVISRMTCIKSDASVHFEALVPVKGNNFVIKKNFCDALLRLIGSGTIFTIDYDSIPAELIKGGQPKVFDGVVYQLSFTTLIHDIAGNLQLEGKEEKDLYKQLNNEQIIIDKNDDNWKNPPQSNQSHYKPKQKNKKSFKSNSQQHTKVSSKSKSFKNKHSSHTSDVDYLQSQSPQSQTPQSQSQSPQSQTPQSQSQSPQSQSQSQSHSPQSQTNAQNNNIKKSKLNKSHNSQKLRIIQEKIRSRQKHKNKPFKKSKRYGPKTLNDIKKKLKKIEEKRKGTYKSFDYDSDEEFDTFEKETNANKSFLSNKQVEHKSLKSLNNIKQLIEKLKKEREIKANPQLGYPKTLDGIKKRLKELEHERNPQASLYKKIRKQFEKFGKDGGKMFVRAVDNTFGWISRSH